MESELTNWPTVWLQRKTLSAAESDASTCWKGGRKEGRASVNEVLTGVTRLSVPFVTVIDPSGSLRSPGNVRAREEQQTEATCC